MAVLKTILHKKNSSGSYDDVYVRTRVDNVLLTDNSTLLSTKLSTIDTTIAGKAASNHTHSEYAASGHTHSASQITGLSSGVGYGAITQFELAKNAGVSKTIPSNVTCFFILYGSSSSGTSASGRNYWYYKLGHIFYWSSSSWYLGNGTKVTTSSNYTGDPSAWYETSDGYYIAFGTNNRSIYFYGRASSTQYITIFYLT